MAQKVEILLIDDVDGTEAHETVEFGADGVAYEIDLNSDNARQLRDTLERWAAHARRTGGRRKSGTSGAARSGGNSESKAIRAWAQDNGHEISARGRIPEDIVQAYRAAQRAQG